jgi:geranylgeranyl pyrophosphate synthase
MEFLRHEVDDILNEVLESLPQNAIQRVMEYALQGGKRVRPSLTIAFFYDQSASPVSIKSKTKAATPFVNGNSLANDKSLVNDKGGLTRNCSNEQYMAASFAATSIEFLHTASLIIDDLPCMDNDSLRRGRPSVHVAFGETTAQLVSTAMTCLSLQLIIRAFRCLENDFGFAQSNALGMRAMEILTEKMGIIGASGGQLLDQAFMKSSISKVTGTGDNNQENGPIIDDDNCQASWKNILKEFVKGKNGLADPAMIEEVVNKKTSTFFELALIFGNMISTGTDRYVDQMSEMGKCLGLSCQLVDDIEDVQQDWECQGENSSISYVLQFGLDAALERFQSHEKRCKQLSQFWITPAVDAIFDIFHKRLHVAQPKARAYMMSFLQQ